MIKFAFQNTMTNKQVIDMLKINMLLAVGYFVGGYLGTLISIPPSHASPIWPAAGIALAGFVSYGRCVIPGIWLGALFTQVFVFLDTSSQESFFYSLLIGGVASTAAIGQAALGAWLTNRYVGKNNPLLDDTSILRFLALAGPVSCVVSALAGVSVLYLQGVIPLENIPAGWLTWWIGDTIGVLIFTPMLLCFIGASRKLWRMRIYSVALPLIVLSLLVLLVLHAGKQHEQARISSLFTEQSNLFHNALQNKLTQQVEISRNLKALFDNSNTVTPVEFKNFTGIVLKDHPSIKALEWIPRVTEENRVFYDQFLSHVQQKTTQPSAQAEYFPIVYLEPYQGNELALGFDVTTQNNSYQALLKARDTNKTTMSGMVNLVQDPSDQSSIVIYSPVYQLHQPLAESKHPFVGVVASVIQINTLVNSVKSEFEQLRLQVKIVDVDYELFNETVHAQKLMQDFPILEKTLTMTVADRSWAVTYTATPQFYNEQLSWNIWWLILGGFMLTGLSGVGLLMLTGRTLQTEHLVKSRTEELETEITQRKRLGQLYALLSQCNQAIVRCTTKKELFLQICNASVQIGGMKMVSILLINHESRRVIPIASFGEGVEYLQNIEISIDPDDPFSYGPEGTSIREDRPAWIQDFLNDPITALWHELGAGFGWGAVASLPIYNNGVVYGVFVLYTDTVNAFDSAVRDLLVEMAMDISFALDNFDRELERKHAEEQIMLAAKVFEQSNEGFMIADANRIIIKVNHAFTAITGYSEIETLGQNVYILSSDQPEQDTYRKLWSIIDTQNYWQGEIWSRRKDGELYPSLLNVSVVRDNLGNINQYIGVFADITQLKASEAQLDFIAHHDALTALPNRLKLFFRLEHAIDVAKRDHKQLALLMLDLDRFKDVNDSFGHLAGDQLLQLVATRLTTRLRDIDTVSRLGGDEFTVLLENISHAQDAARIAQEIIDDFSHPWAIPNCGEVLIGVTIGISLYPQYGDTPELLLQQADTALYKAKESGRNRFAYFSNEFTRDARERIEMEARLRRGIAQNELRVYYQPQIDIISGAIIGAEALVRWQDPVEGLIQPNRFIAMAEQTGLIAMLGAWVLKEACRQGKQWLDQGFQPLILAVNVSPYQLRQSNINTLVADILSETQFPAEYLELELTEGSLMERQTEIVELLIKLRAQGVRLAIDDFGTGYSSLAYLKRFPLDVLKIDKSFIDDIPHHKDDMEIAATIIAMGHTLGFNVLAEGVETHEQLAFLRKQGCHSYQGYLKSRPLPANEFVEFLTKLKL